MCIYIGGITQSLPSNCYALTHYTLCTCTCTLSMCDVHLHTYLPSMEKHFTTERTRAKLPSEGMVCWWRMERGVLLHVLQPVGVGVPDRLATHIRTYVHTYVYTCVHPCVHTRMHSMYVHVCIYMYMHKCTCMCTHKYMYMLICTMSHKYMCSMYSMYIHTNHTHPAYLSSITGQDYHCPYHIAHSQQREKTVHYVPPAVEETLGTEC